MPLSSSHRPPGVISTSEAYTIKEFRLRCGIGDFAFRELRKQGFPIIAVGKKRFVLGKSWVDWLGRILELQIQTGG